MCTQDIIAALMEEDGLSLDEAMNKFYTSVAFEKLNNPDTGLYLEGTDYLMEYFETKKLL